MTTYTRDFGHSTHGIYSTRTHRLLGDGDADGFMLDGRRECAICEERKPEHHFGDARDIGICHACWQDHDAMVREMGA